MSDQILLHSLLRLLPFLRGIQESSHPQIPQVYRTQKIGRPGSRLRRLGDELSFLLTGLLWSVMSIVTRCGNDLVRISALVLDPKPLKAPSRYCK